MELPTLIFESGARAPICWGDRRSPDQDWTMSRTDLTSNWEGDSPSPRARDAFRAGAGEIVVGIRALDWRKTPVGPSADRPEGLKSTRMMLEARDLIDV
jgi:hypothetical protein